MPKFLWSGRTASGQEEVEEVEAETPADAGRILEERGWTELRQHTTDLQDFIARQMQDSCEQEAPDLTPKEQLKLYQGKGPGLLRAWFNETFESGPLLFALVAGAVVAAWAGHRITMWCLLGVVAFLVLLYPALRLWYGQSQTLFTELNTASNWRRWDDVLKCLARLPRVQRATKIGIGDFAAARYRGMALAGLGKLDEGLAQFHIAAEKANTPPWLLHSFEGGIYGVAGQYDKTLACYRQAYDEAVDKSVVCLDMGVLLVQRFNRPAEAKALLAEAEKAQLAELARVHLFYLRGAIAYRERDFKAVDQHMRSALAKFEEFAVNQHHIFEPILLICQGYLAISSAALGRKDEAARFAENSMRYLSVIRLDELVQEYKTHMGSGVPA